MRSNTKSSQLPEDWKELSLGEICSFENGDRGKNYPSRSEFTDVGIPFINAGHLTDKGIDKGSLNYIPQEKFDQLGNGKIKVGDVLFCLRGSLGKCALVEDLDEGAIASSLVIVRSRTMVINKYLMAYFGSSLCASMVAKFGNGAAQPNLSARSLKEFSIPLPPLPEQKRIVAILDEVFAGIDDAIANTEKNLINARELFESYSDAVFTQRNKDWKWVSLSDITTAVTDGDHQPPPKSPSGIPFITISNIDKRNRKIDFSNTFKVPPEYFENLKDNRKPRRGDLLYTVTGSYGIPVVVDHDVNFCFQRHIGLIRPNDVTNPKCLYYMFLSRSLLKQADDCATGTAQKTVSLRALRKFSVPLIPQSVQRSIVDELDVVSAQAFRLEAIYQQKLTALNELKQSILQKAFTGELTADTASQATRTKAEIAA